jgi:heptosyltransferase II
MMSMKTDYQKILVINLGGIGDVLVSTPALKALKQTFPRASITMLVSPIAAGLARDFPYVDRVQEFYFDTGRALQNVCTLLVLWARHFDIAFNMRSIVSERGARRIQRMLSIIKPRSSAGRNTDGRGAFFSLSIPETLQGEKHEMEYDLDLVQAAGAEVSDRTVDLFRDGPSIHKIGVLLAQQGFEPGTALIGIHPGGKKSHRWPLHYFCSVVKGLNNHFPSAIFVITGDASEAGLGNTIRHNVAARVVNLAGSLTVKETVSLIRQFSLYITNDTGPMHIAAVAGVPLVAIFGPGYVRRFDPTVLSPKALMLYKLAECAPCDLVDCPDKKCLSAIMPEEVIDAAVSLLQRGENR